MNGPLQAALEAAKPELQAMVLNLRDQFMASFGSWVQTTHHDRLEALFVAAGESRIRGLLAPTTAIAVEEKEIYETLIASIETLGLAIEVVTKAVALAILKSTIHQLLATLATVAGVVVKAVVAVVVPGVGSLAGPIAGTGLEHALAWFFTKMEGPVPTLPGAGATLPSA